LLYRRVRINASTAKTPVDVALLRVAHSKPTDFLADAVRFMELTAFPWNELDDGWSNTELSTVLRLCTGVSHLALIGDFSDDRLLSMLLSMHPMHLALAADVITGHHLSLSHLFFLRNVSHLHLFDADTQHFRPTSTVLANWSCWARMSCLPTLTHLVFPCPTTSSAGLPHVLADLPNLRALILLSDELPDGGYSLSEHLPLCDPRVVVIKTDRAFGARSSVNFWELAEASLTKKQTGKIKSPSSRQGKTPQEFYAIPI
jgi:hypothetical protein